MKKYILIISFLLCLPLLALSQEFIGGLSGGISATQIDGETQVGYNKLGFIFGGYVKRMFNNKIGGQFEIKYFDKGSHKSQHPDKNDYTLWTIKLHYVEMPLVVTYTFKEIYTFEAGISIGYLIHFAYDDGSGNISNPGMPYRKFDYSSTAGFNYKISERFSVTMRGSYSVISTLKKHLDVTSWYYNIFRKGQFNNDIGFTMNYKL